MYTVMIKLNNSNLFPFTIPELWKTCITKRHKLGFRDVLRNFSKKKIKIKKLLLKNKQPTYGTHVHIHSDI